MALVTDSLSVWLRYEVKYNMLLRLKESGQVNDLVYMVAQISYFVKCRVNTNNIQQIFISVIFHVWLVKFNVCIMPGILMTPHVHI